MLADDPPVFESGDLARPHVHLQGVGSRVCLWVRYSSRLKNKCLAEAWSVCEEDSCLRLTAPTCTCRVSGSNSHGARLIISRIKWIRTSRLLTENSLSLSGQGCGFGFGWLAFNIQLIVHMVSGLGVRV